MHCYLCGSLGQFARYYLHCENSRLSHFMFCTRLARAHSLSDVALAIFDTTPLLCAESLRHPMLCDATEYLEITPMCVLGAVHSCTMGHN